MQLKGASFPRLRWIATILALSRIGIPKNQELWAPQRGGGGTSPTAVLPRQKREPTVVSYMLGPAESVTPVTKEVSL
jgi:hypothetical protein